MHEVGCCGGQDMVEGCEEMVKGVVCEELFYDVRGLWYMKELKGIQRLLTVLFALYGLMLSPPLHFRYT